MKNTLYMKPFVLALMSPSSVLAQKGGFGQNPWTGDNWGQPATSTLYASPPGGYGTPPGGYGTPPGGYPTQPVGGQPTGGQPTIGTGQPTIATGQPTIATGQPTIATGPAQPSPTNNGTTSPNTCGANVQKISLQNTSGGTLMIQAGPPWTVGNCGTIANGATCTFCQPRGSTGGNLQIGFNAMTSRGTWIEGNWDTSAAEPTVDISFIPGYSVPIMCTSDLTGAQNGWAKPLCTTTANSPCQSCTGTAADLAETTNGRWDPVGKSCVNPAGDMGSGKFPDGSKSQPINDGPCPAPFGASQGGAYCYPNDNGVVGYGSPWSSVSCTAYPQSTNGGSSSGAKRDVNERELEEKPLTAEQFETRDVKIAHRHLGAHGGARSHARSLKAFFR